jgi:hypothetical protein
MDRYLVDTHNKGFQVLWLSRADQGEQPAEKKKWIGRRSTRDTGKE